MGSSAWLVRLTYNFRRREAKPMKTLNRCLMSAVVLVLSACASNGVSAGRSLPYNAWHLGFVAPNYMEVWVEAAEVQDVRGRLFAKHGSGTAAINYTDDAAGWSRYVGLGASREIVGADLPKRLYVRWQSLAEPQTYRVFLDIPDEARRLMLTKVRHRTMPEEFYRDALVVGLAPGGWVKVWVSGAAGVATEVLCTRAEVEPKGPYEGLSDGKFRPLSERAAPYVKSHPIPYESWACAK